MKHLAWTYVRGQFDGSCVYCTVDVLHNHTVEQYGERAGYYSPALANYNYSHRIHPTEREMQIQTDTERQIYEKNKQKDKPVQTK